ncbi:hypothetical protein BDZ85DRAFT_174774, partial [Elsinoe ampelina]
INLTWMLSASNPVVMAQLYPTILPSASRAITSDPWQCATENMTSLFMPLTPSGVLLDALVSHGEVLLDEYCPRTQAVCLFPAYSKWCSFTHTAPTSVLSEYRSYGSVANAWLAARSSTMVELAEGCPNYWYKAINQVFLAENRINNTIAMAECYAAAQNAPVSSTASS